MLGYVGQIAVVDGQEYYIDSEIHKNFGKELILEGVRIINGGFLDYKSHIYIAVKDGNYTVGNSIPSALENNNLSQILMKQKTVNRR